MGRRWWYRGLPISGLYRSMERRQVTPSIFTLSEVLSSTECQQMIDFAEAQGFDAATINAWDGPRLDTEV